MLHARILRSPYPHARIVRVDASAVPGGVVALVPDDVRGLAGYGCQIRDQTVLALDRALFAGDPVAAVAAPTLEEAEDALGLIEVEYEELPAVLDLEEAIAGRTLVHERIRISENDAAYFGIRPEQGTNVCHRFRIVHGDADAGFAQADVVVEETFRTPAAQHAPLEPHACLARWENGRLELWTGTHTPFNVRSDVARVFGIPEDAVRVVVPPMGGSFGAKTFVHLEALTAALARKAGRPVRCVLPRAEEWVTNNRHPALLTVKVGATADGLLVAKRVDSWIDTGAYADCGPGVAQKIGYSAVGPYRIPHVRVESRCVYTNRPPNGAYRGFGATQAAWASERTIDLLADRLGIDPLELRLRNVLRDGDVFCTGETVHDVHFAECLERAAAAVGWREGRAGKGLCVLLKGMQTPSRAQIAVEAEEGGGYTIRCATAELGQGARRALSLVAAELLGAPPSEIRFPDPDTDVVPYDTRATSSRSTYMMSNALEEAVGELRRDGRRGVGEFRNAGGLDPDTGQGVASSHWHQGAAAAEIRVDEETGRLEVVRLHAAVYAGRVVNPPGAELQNEGSMIMGLGTALFETVAFAEGQVVNANLSDYEVPSIADLPESLTHDLLTKPGAEVHGLGETALPPVPAAIGNALGSLGIHVTELPLLPETVLEAIDRRDGGDGR
ncbi:MAG: xanthine dehydrogenase family protein [Thermoleophilia bacterium]|nr:xanthine dehydrogenase family protein [Thermoleophilia bacterium]